MGEQGRGVTEPRQNRNGENEKESTTRPPQNPRGLHEQRKLDQFFTIRGSDDSFEWYAEWPQIRDVLYSHLPPPPTATAGGMSENKKNNEIKILVPGCGNSKLSECLYDEGFRNVTNIDFSKVVVSDMLKRNVRSRPEMKWRVMDMTNMQFEKESFDVVLDKGGLDALMEPKLGPELGNRYLSEVKRVLKEHGKFVCLTLAESHVLGLLFPKFRCGWEMSLHAIPQKASVKSSLLTFIVIAEKNTSSSFSLISSSINQSNNIYGTQEQGLRDALESENQIRSQYSSESDILYSLADLKLGTKGNLEELNPGRRIQLTLGEPGGSRFVYRAVLLDAQEESGPFSYHCGVFLVPKTRAHEWLFSSEEGQWLVVDNSKAARLIMILLDVSQADASMDDIQKDLSPLVKQLAPRDCDDNFQIPFMAASDGIKERKVVHQVISSLTGSITVEDVIYENNEEDISRLFPSEDLTFRRLIFQRTEGLIQSEALLTKDTSQQINGEREQKKGHLSTKQKRRGNSRRPELNNSLRVDHNFLASSYHSGIISGFALISSYLEGVATDGGKVKAVVIGLGAGLLPMFLNKCLPLLDIDVVELDASVVGLAREFFGFREGEYLQVHVTDGIKYVKEVADHSVAGVLKNAENNDVQSGNKSSLSNVNDGVSLADGRLPGIDILIIDVDSSDSSFGLTCPAAEFVEESFLLSAKSALSEQGLFVINLVSRSTTIKDMVFSRMKMVFSNLYYLKLDEDVNAVIFALNQDIGVLEDHLPEACEKLSRLLKLEQPGVCKRILDATSKIERVN